MGLRLSELLWQFCFCDWWSIRPRNTLALLYKIGWLRRTEIYGLTSSCQITSHPFGILGGLHWEKHGETGINWNPVERSYCEDLCPNVYDQQSSLKSWFLVSSWNYIPISIYLQDIFISPHDHHDHHDLWFRPARAASWYAAALRATGRQNVMGMAWEAMRICDLTLKSSGSFLVLLECKWGDEWWYSWIELANIIFGGALKNMCFDLDGDDQPGSYRKSVNHHEIWRT